jgi:hypothetical protein
MARTYRRLFSFLTASLVLRATVAAIVGSGAFLASSDIIKPTRESEALRQPVVDHGTNNLTNTAQNDDISTITSFSEHRLQVDDGVRGAQFGFSVDVDGDTAVVSAPGDGDNRGSAYVYSRVGEEWILRQKLSSTDGTSDDHFGWDVAISGDTIVVGSYDLNEVDHGAAYVFTGSNGTWNQQQKLTPAIGSVTEQFGSSVAISGETVLVGAHGSDGFRGAAYVFVRNGGTWSEQQKLSGSDTIANDEFGWSVDLSGETAIIGAPRVQSAKGAAYVFSLSGSVWSEQQKLTASDGSAFAQFGYSVGIDGETAIVGAVLDGGEMNKGSAYIFERSGASWTQLDKLEATAGAKNDKFGESVSINGNTAVIGANGRDVGGIPDQGTAYVFTRAGPGWTLQQELSPTDAGAGDSFGGSVAAGNGVVLVGSYLKDVVKAPGTALDHGAAYLFMVPVQSVNVSGRVLSAQGNAVRGAKVILTDTVSGVSATFTTAQLGFFSFQNVATGRTYRITVTSKRYRYISQTFELTDSISDLEFRGVE